MTSSTAHTYGTNQSSGFVKSQALNTGSNSGHRLVIYPASFVKIDTLGGHNNHALNTGSVSTYRGGVAISHAAKTGSVSVKTVRYPASLLNTEIFGGVASHAVNIGSVSGTDGTGGATYIASFSHVYLLRTYCMYLWSANSI
jgi:hypothetical protein